jgi:hypothetical protein
VRPDCQARQRGREREKEPRGQEQGVVVVVPPLAGDERKAPPLEVEPLSRYPLGVCARAIRPGRPVFKPAGQIRPTEVNCPRVFEAKLAVADELLAVVASLAGRVGR